MGKLLWGILSLVSILVQSTVAGNGQLTATSGLRDHAPRARKAVIAVIGGIKPAQFNPAVSGEAAVPQIIDSWRKKIAQVLPDRPDLILLPEVSDRFSLWNEEQREAYYQARGDRFLDFIRQTAHENRCYIACPLLRLLPDGTRRNSIVLADRNGDIACIYDKVFPTVYEIRAGVVPGRDPVVFETDFGRVGFIICFDLNFNELLERYIPLKPDLLVFGSAYHGGLMQGIWAYHCRAYLASAIINNECAVLNPLGEKVARSSNYCDSVVTRVNLDYQVVHLDENWAKLRALKSRYGEQVDIFDPGNIGAVLVTSRHPDISSAQMISEFKIELWDDYYRRSLDTKMRHTPMQP